MNRLMVFFAFCFVVGSILCGIADGQTSITSTQLESSVTSSSETFTVSTTTGFPDTTAADDDRYFVVNGEIIHYTTTSTNTFDGCSRGQTHPQTGKSSSASSHDSGSYVMSLAASAVNNTLVYNLAESLSSVGAFASFIFSGDFAKGLVQLITWDYSFLQGGLSVVRVMLLCLSAGFIFSIVLAMISLAQQILRV